MNCSWHPNKRTVAACKECGADFCIECVRETDQTTLCPDCYRRRLNEIALEFAEPAEEEVAGSAVTPAQEGLPRVEPLLGGEEAGPAAAEREGPVRGGDETAPEAVAALAAEDFLSRGPDDDFSRITGESRRPGRRARGKKPAAAAERGAEQAAEPAAADGKPTTAAFSEDRLLQDVVSTLLKPETGAGAGIAAAGQAAAAAEAEDTRAALKEARRQEARERWSFLAQPRSSEHTLIATSWWRAALFIVLMLLLGAVLWAVPNVFIIPGDGESGIHAVLVGLILGLAFWWKAGRKHGTKLAVQAAATTLFALIIGEFLHWFLTIVRYEAFREIFFDLVSFRFLWENGGDILRHVGEAMFPVAFIWLLLLPTAVAFIVGFGLPPIPEYFFQLWNAVRGRVPENKGASHGMEG